MSGASARDAGRGAFARWLPLIGLAVVMALVFAMGWHRVLSFKTIALNYDVLRDFISRHLVAALLIYMAGYIVMVALSLPGGAIMTVAGGLLFGWELAVPASVIGATIGATILFLIVKSSLGESLAAKAGPVLAKLREGFKENALSYLLFLRLVPAFPFWLVNLAPALLGVSLRTFVIGTFLGIIPGTAAFSFAGAGLGSGIETQNVAYRMCLAQQAAKPELACEYAIDTSALVTSELLVGFVLLGVIALLPVGIKLWGKRHAAA
ncbi:MAG TPA: VTT domain-containing protein [Hyphomicrobiaceae bacterium]|nr:VTT domain-containing protein [Hyphomicrobiaceae bacterium]